jgi:hypothetical protein
MAFPEDHHHGAHAARPALATPSMRYTSVIVHCTLDMVQSQLVDDRPHSLHGRHHHHTVSSFHAHGARDRDHADDHDMTMTHQTP